MSAAGAPRAADVAFDLALSLVLAGVAFWAGAEWFRELHRDTLDSLADDFEDVVSRAVDAHLARESKPVPESHWIHEAPFEPDPDPVPAVKRRKVPRQSDPTE